MLDNSDEMPSIVEKVRKITGSDVMLEYYVDGKLVKSFRV